MNVPNTPQLQLGFTGGDSIGPVGYRGSATVTVPLTDPSLQNTNIGANFGFNVPGTPSLTNIPGTNIPLTNVRVSGNYNPTAGLTGGMQYSGTNQLFNVSDQWKLAVWCEQNGLTQQADVHLREVLRLDPKRESAWKRLGFKRVGGRWIKPADAAAAAARTPAACNSPSNRTTPQTRSAAPSVWARNTKAASGSSMVESSRRSSMK